MTTCFFHSDEDGALSAAVVQHAEGGNIQLIPINYGWKLPWYKLTPGERVYVVDFCFSPMDMKTLYEKYDLVWIDHHDTSLREMKEAGFVANGLQRDGTAACKLCWEFLFPDKPLPRSIDLISRYDVGEGFDDDDVMKFQTYVRHKDGLFFPHRPESKDVWQTMLTSDTFVDQAIQEIKPVYDYIHKQNEVTRNYTSFETMFHGHVALAANAANVNPSTFFGNVDPNRHEITITFYFSRKGEWKFSLRQVEGNPKKVDVGQIASVYGGGGHKEASGFSTIPSKFPLVLDPSMTV